jgi:hypothetical protein
MPKNMRAHLVFWEFSNHLWGSKMLPFFFEFCIATPRENEPVSQASSSSGTQGARMSTFETKVSNFGVCYPLHSSKDAAHHARVSHNPQNPIVQQTPKDTKYKTVSPEPLLRQFAGSNTQLLTANVPETSNAVCAVSAGLAEHQEGCLENKSCDFSPNPREPPKADLATLYSDKQAPRLCQGVLQRRASLSQLLVNQALWLTSS